MSRFLKREPRFTAEDWKTLYNATSDTTTPLTFVSDLVSGDYTNKDVWQNLLKVAWEDPIAKRICIDLSKNVWDDWFVIRKRAKEDKDKRGEELEEHPDNEQIQEEFERMNAALKAAEED